MNVDMIIKAFSVLLVVLILLSTLYAPLCSVLDINSSRFLEETFEAVKSKCPIIVLCYLVYVFYARGSTAGVTRKTGFVVLGACGLGLAVNVVYGVFFMGITMDFLTAVISTIYSSAVWVFCAAVNVAVQEKKSSKNG